MPPRSRTIVLSVVVVAVLAGPLTDRLGTATAAVTPVALHTAGVASVPSTPSGSAMPGDLPGLKRTFADDFTGSQLRAADWSRYSGVSKSSAITRWSPSDVVVSGGVAHLITRWDGKTAVAGAISTAVEGGQSYGKWIVRMRTPKAAGVYYDVALYPEGGGWPPEIDFAENGGGARDHILATLHYTSQNLQLHRTLSGIDFSQWHTVGVTTSRGQIQYTIDGRVWATVKTASVPSQRMWLTIQTEISDCTSTSSSCPGPSTPATTDTQVDWVARYTAD